VIEWRDYKRERIISRFSKADWHNIISDISTEKGLIYFLQLDFVRAYVAYNGENTPVAFAFIIEDVLNKNQVEVHGGSWSQSAWCNYEALITLLERLLAEGKDVRSQCNINNRHTLRFLESLGFVNINTSDHYHHFSLSQERLYNSIIYKRLHT